MSNEHGVPAQRIYRAPGTAAQDGSSESPQPRYVYPGHVVVSAKGDRLTTVLGSCVAVCLFDPEIRAGGMNHFLLPNAGGGVSWSPRFPDRAIPQLIGQLLDLGADRRRLVAKVFGGCVSVDTRSNGFHVGSRNVEAARQLLREEGIPILTEDVGGSQGRRLEFCTDDGTAWVRLV